MMKDRILKWRLSLRPICLTSLLVLVFLPLVVSATPGFADEKRPPKIGLEGYCPVSLVEERTWTLGQARIYTHYDGCKYVFATTRKLKRFLAEPEKFAPAGNGLDVVVAVKTGGMTWGKRAHGVFSRGRILLFESEASLQQFRTSPSTFVALFDEMTKVNRRELIGRADMSDRSAQPN